MGSKIVKIFFSEDQLIHVMRFPTTISSRVGLARDSEMESTLRSRTDEKGFNDQRSTIKDQRSTIKSMVSMGIPRGFDHFLTIFRGGGRACSRVDRSITHLFNRKNFTRFCSFSIFETPFFPVYRVSIYIWGQMGAKIVKSFFRKDQLIHVMRFPTTISSRVGLARDSVIERDNIVKKLDRLIET